MIKEQANNSPYERIREASEPYKWKPGESGNPAGRPPSSITSELRKLSEEIGADGVTGRKKLADKLWALAMYGKIDAIDKIIDRLDGKVPDKHQIEGAEAGMVVIKFVPANRLTENAPKQIAEGDDATE